MLLWLIHGSEGGHGKIKFHWTMFNFHVDPYMTIESSICRT
jgi:hypothetical protein